MNLTVQLRAFYPQDGRDVLAEIFIVLVDSVLFRDPARYRLLKYVDPYGNTVLNRIQMVDLMEDLKFYRSSLQRKVTKPADLDELEHLAERCRDEVHLYLQFIGD